MKDFVASVQYNDWKGTCAADNADFKSLQSILRETGQLEKDESLVGLSFFASYGDRVLAQAYAIPFGEREVVRTGGQSQIRGRKIDLKLTTDQFFKMFKRFDIVLTEPHLNLEGREFIDPEE